MDEKIKNSIKIEFVDHSGDKHIFYNEKVNNNDQLQFVGLSIARFLKSMGWSGEVIQDVMESIDYELEIE